MRQRILLALALSSVLLFALAGTLWARREPPVYAPQGPGELYLALGDSLAWGFRLDDPARESYPALIHAALADPAATELLNLSVPGETSGSFVARQLPRAVEQIAAARRAGRSVSPITLDIGGNDLRNVERAPSAEREAAVEAARRNIALALDELRRAAGSRADIAVMTYYNPYGGDADEVGGDAYWVERLNQAIREEAALRGVAVADVYPDFAGGRFYTHTFILLGDIHANALGHSLMAERFLAALGYQNE
jgi:lysophospholipase L1-like esterase